MELRHLRFFVPVAETENVSRAALKLHVSQPAVSRQIRDLEDEIGFCLLERTAKSVRLTDAGGAFLNDARALLQQGQFRSLHQKLFGRRRSGQESARDRQHRTDRAESRLFAGRDGANFAADSPCVSRRDAEGAREVA